MTHKHNQLYSRRVAKEKGNILVFFAVGALFLVSLAAFLLGVGLLTVNGGKLQNVLNLAATTALNAYFRAGANTNPERAQYALRAANDVITANTLYFGKGSLSQLTLYSSHSVDSGGFLQFGTIYNQPTGVVTASCAEYPCFVPFAGTPPEGSSPNAVKLTARTTETSRVTQPLLRFISPNMDGSTELDFSRSAIARVNERCIGFVLDISLSSTAESHNFASQPYFQEWRSRTSIPPSTSGRFELIRPKNGGLFALELPDGSNTINCGDTVGSPGDDHPVYNTNGTSDNYADDTWNFSTSTWQAEQMYYCGLQPSRYAGAPANQHFRDDYVLRDTPFGKVLIDAHTPPEPLSSYMVGINAALRTLESQRVTSDKVMIMGFSRRVYFRLPQIGLTSNLRFLIDITDMRRAGLNYFDPVNKSYNRLPEMHPNYLDRGILPLPNHAKTDISGALLDASNQLATYCAKDARKVIVLATDGKANIYNNAWGQVPSAINRYNTYQAYERQLLDPVHPSGVLNSLLKNNISVAVMLHGKVTAPNFKNILAGASPNVFLDMLTAIARGARGGLPEYRATNEIAFFDIAPTLPDFEASGGYIRAKESICQDSYNLLNNPSTQPRWMRENKDFVYNSCAYLTAGEEGAVFRRPNGTLGQLAVLTKGTMCPLMEPYRTASGDIDMECYDSTTLNWKSGAPACERKPGTYQTRAVRALEVAGQAADCALDAIGAAPFSLFAE